MTPFPGPTDRGPGRHGPGRRAPWPELTRDARLLFAARAARMFAYGSLAVVLALYLAALGFDGVRIGLLLSLTLVGDTLISLWLTTHADGLGRRRVLVAGAGLMLLAGIAFALSGDFLVLLLAATIGVISPSGNEVGPFLAVEQAALAETIPGERRTSVLAWYNLVGQVATAVGSLTAGIATTRLIALGIGDLGAYRAVVVAYATVGSGLALLFSRVSPAVEVRPGAAGDGIRRRLGLGRSRGVVLRLSALFSLDAFAGGFVPQSLIAWWLHLRFGADGSTLGAVFFTANLLAAASALSAARLAGRFGLVNTMVFTHLPSNVLLLLVPFMPTLPLAIGVLLARFSISQMDVPTRQSYTLAVVEPNERSAAAGVTGVARTTGAAVSPALAAPLIDGGLGSLAFVAAGGIKIAYDLLLYRAFRALRTPEEEGRGR